ncbi:hypothetical protein Tcan_14088 [Toxocara canis]|uniref:Uncharacterized protein n=1 Tax=Toxocara canis TaxID=6265 RepID=A0A0B2V745_TOXCA|nr:hypothetical protein Tcan_14088 [Toxocara canis]
MRRSFFILLAFSVQLARCTLSDGDQRCECKSKSLRGTFTNDELRELEKTLTSKNTYHPTNISQQYSSSIIESLCYVLRKHLAMSCQDEGSHSTRRKKSAVNGVSVYRDEDKDQLHITDCLSYLNRCIRQVHMGAVDDFLLTSNGSHIYYLQGKQVYASNVKNFAIRRKTISVFNVSSQRSRLLYSNAKLNLLYEECGDKVKRFMLYKLGWCEPMCVLSEYGKRMLRMKRAINRTKISIDPFVEEQQREAKITVILGLVFGVPLATLLIIAIIAIIACCCYCRKSTDDSQRENDDDCVPQSLVENARKAEPRPSQKDRFLPENFDVKQFQFKGPLVIERKPVFTSFHELEGDPPQQQTPEDHVEFDETMNEAYEIGEGVEKFAEHSKPASPEKQNKDAAFRNRSEHAAIVEAAAAKEVRDALAHALRRKHSAERLQPEHPLTTSSTQASEKKLKAHETGAILRNILGKKQPNSTVSWDIDDTQMTQCTAISPNPSKNEKKSYGKKSSFLRRQKSKRSDAPLQSTQMTQPSAATETTPRTPVTSPNFSYGATQTETLNSQTATITGRTTSVSPFPSAHALNVLRKRFSVRKKTVKETSKEMISSTRTSAEKTSEEKTTVTKSTKQSAEENLKERTTGKTSVEQPTEKAIKERTTGKTSVKQSAEKNLKEKPTGTACGKQSDKEKMKHKTVSTKSDRRSAEKNNEKAIGAKSSRKTTEENSKQRTSGTIPRTQSAEKNQKKKQLEQVILTNN